MGRRGFSLVELLVAIGIIAILIAASLASYRGLRIQATERQAAAHGGAVAQAIAGYLALYLGETAASLHSRLALPPASWQGFPGQGSPIQGLLADPKACTSSFVLPDASGSPTRFSWPRAPRNTGCVVGLQSAGGVTRLTVVTWAQGGRRVYVDGQ